MTNDERLAAYLTGRSRTTPAQKRRIKHKERAASTHSHAGLPVADIGGGRRKRVPCPRCCQLPKQKLIGG